MPNDEAVVKNALSSLEKVEICTKSVAAALPLTYVSGYLIATSYLGTYGLHPDASDLFRIRYIYVGSLYLVFLSLITSFAWLAIQIVSAVGLFLRRYAFSPEEEEKFARDAYKELEARAKGESLRDRSRELRWYAVVTFILTTFSFEIMFLNPENMRWYLPSHVVLLLAVVVYQFSYFAEVRPPYSWGLVHGRIYVEYSRWTLFFSAIAACSCMIWIAWRTVLHGTYTPWIHWGLNPLKAILVVALAMEILAVCAFLAKSRRLIAVDANWKRLRPSVRSPERGVDSLGHKQLCVEVLQIFASPWACFLGYITCAASRWRAIFRGLVWAFLVALVDLWPFYFRPVYLNGNPKGANALLGGLALSLSLAVIVNLFLLVIMFGNRRKVLENCFGNLRDHGSSFSFGFKQKRVNGWLGADMTSTVIRVRRKLWEQRVRRTVLITVLYIVSVLSFAYLVYPHIPVQKAGGNYATAFRVSPRLVTSGNERGCPADLLPVLNIKHNFIIIEEDSDWVYFADDNGPDGPRAWVWPRFGEGTVRPKVHAISRTCIASIDMPAEAGMP